MNSNNRFNSKKFDSECYKKEQEQNKNINNYLLTKNDNIKYNCYQDNPEIRNQMLSELKNTDVETKLFGIDRKDICDNFHTCSDDICNTQVLKKLEKPLDECNLATVHSRYYHNNIKEIGINRWENLKYNPQKYAIFELYNQINSRQIIKDKYKASLLKPQDHTNHYEHDNKFHTNKTKSVNTVPFQNEKKNEYL